MSKSAFGNKINKVFGPAADELAEMWRDRVRLCRYKRQLECVLKAERMVQEAGFTAQAVPSKISFPLFDDALFEKNEELQDKWAALLANAESAKILKQKALILSKLRYLPQQLVSWFMSGNNRDSFIGDLEERHAAISKTKGHRSAQLWFWRQVFQSLFPLVIAAIRRVSGYDRLMDFYQRKRS
jgi:hypothetical protein